MIYEKFNLSANPVDKLTSDNPFLKTDDAHGIIFKDERSGEVQNFTMEVDPGYEFLENFRGGVQ